MCRECDMPFVDDSISKHYVASGYAIGQETSTNNLGTSLVLRRAIERRMPHHLVSNYIPANNKYPDIWPDNILYAKHDYETPTYFVAYELEDAIVHVFHPGNSRSQVDIHVFATSLEVANARMSEIRSAIPSVPKQNKVVSNIDLVFWMMSGNGPKQVRRTISVPSWNEIQDNYTAPVSQAMSDMVSGFKPSRGGQLVLWHGEPGTGKTYALRALGREWRQWCDFHYIMDPERFFGHDADYLMTVLLDQRYSVLDDDDEFDEEYVDGEDRWKLLIFEDTGELMSADAQERAGAGLGRFLNTVDGLIGQGLKVLLLVTTNQELGRLHPAVARSGRANVITEFKQLTASESAAWGTARGVRVEDRSHTLSDLYAALNGSRRQPEPVPIGFARRPG